jgi:hypothetical protein
MAATDAAAEERNDRVADQRNGARMIERQAIDTSR